MEPDYRAGQGRVQPENVTLVCIDGAAWRLGAGNPSGRLIAERPPRTLQCRSMRLIDYFSSAYVVNLPSRTDRRMEMELMLTRLGMMPLPEKLAFFPAIRPADAGGFPSIGARGCFLSHLELLKIALARGAERVLVMEDDLDIAPNLAAIEGPIVEQLQQQPWGLVYLGHYAEGLPPSNTGLVRANNLTMCSHFYGINQPFLEQLVTYLESILLRPAGHPDGGPMHYDGALSMFRERTGIPTLFATPCLGWQRSSRSDVAPNKWYDKIPGTRWAVSRARRLRNFVRRPSL